MQQKSINMKMQPGLLAIMGYLYKERNIYMKSRLIGNNGLIRQGRKYQYEEVTWFIGHNGLIRRGKKY